MDALSVTDASRAQVLDTADNAYRSVNRLNEILRYWSSAPSDVCRLRDTTARLHNLLTSFWRAQRDGDAAVTETLACDIKYTTDALGELSRVLDFVSRPDVLASLRQTRSMVRIKSRWSMRRDTICVLQLQLDESCHRLLARLLEAHV